MVLELDLPADVPMAEAEQLLDQADQTPKLLIVQGLRNLSQVRACSLCVQEMTRPRADTMLAIQQSRFACCFQGQGCELPLYQGLLKKPSVCLSMPALVRFVMVGMHGFGLRSHRQCTWTILLWFSCMTMTTPNWLCEARLT